MSNMQVVKYVKWGSARPIAMPYSVFQRWAEAVSEYCECAYGVVINVPIEFMEELFVGGMTREECASFLARVST